jgi:hypothetical protein
MSSSLNRFDLKHILIHFKHFTNNDISITQHQAVGLGKRLIDTSGKKNQNEQRQE